MLVADILRHKGGQVVSVFPDVPVSRVLAVLGSHRIGAVLVIDRNGGVHGILSERDIVRRLWREGTATMEMPAQAVMTRHLVTALPSTTVAEVMQMMTVGRFRHVPVIDQGQLLGLISIGDVVKARIDEQEEENVSLRAYIAGAA
jgi:CBS domain-containing protein